MELGDDQGQRESGRFEFALEPSRPTPADMARRALDFSDRPPRVRPTTSVLEWIAFVFAFLVPPLGLVLVVVARIVTRYRHHWTTKIARAATAISIVLTLLLAGGGVVYSVIAGKDAEQAAVLAEARPLCEAIAATPGVLDTPGYGWPTEVTALAQTLESMRVYQSHWAQLAALAPETAKANLGAIADQAAVLVAAVETTQAIDRQGNLAKMSAVTAASTLPAWTAAHCG